MALPPDKTRLIEFGRFAAKDRRQRGQRKPETFDFQGFTHICARTRVNQTFHVRRTTVSKRLRAKLQAIRQALLKQRHRPVPVQTTWLRDVVQGHYNFYAIPGNMPALETFRREVLHHWLHALRRSSQRKRLPWSRFGRLTDRWIPKPTVLHPHPNQRFLAKHPR
jgi:RNA-directed DNA polymerase